MDARTTKRRESTRLLIRKSWLPRWYLDTDPAAVQRDELRGIVDAGFFLVKRATERPLDLSFGGSCSVRRIQPRPMIGAAYRYLQ